jgi:hypothetical protein
MVDTERTNVNAIIEDVLAAQDKMLEAINEWNNVRSAIIANHAGIICIDKPQPAIEIRPIGAIKVLIPS